ncbi:MAG: nucleotidyl transferase AbiEii/AbiGii toxin family protein [Proteobacteria bacterium]|nr:nucleotidyl transferase AbiEii/AbiGii toxin family protein [Pseudomonadota bacterium]
MIPITEINAAADKYGVPGETIEKDYVISWILFCLSKSQLKNNFIFYGGTAIKRMYFEEHRYSEDIDLISSGRFRQEYLLKELEVLQKAREEANLNLAIDLDGITVEKDRIQLFVKYSGYDEIGGVPKEVRLDFTMDRSLDGEIADKKIIESYSDLRTITETLSVMTLNTILANKLGMLTEITRNEPRDLFDIWFLLERTNQFDFSFDQVCKIFKNKYGFSPTLNILKPRLLNNSFKVNWDMRLKKQIAKLPSVEVVIKSVGKKLDELFGESKQ